MSQLTERERRNLALVDEWAAAWNQPGGSAQKLLDEIYAEALEVRAPLQRVHLHGAGGRKILRGFEEAGEKALAERTMIFHKRLARGDIVALEVEVAYRTHDGDEGRDWFAAFLTFDDDGRIVEDHSFMRDEPFTPHPGDAPSRA